MSQPKRPNILFIMTDDHAAQAMSCYGSPINETPNMDRIAAGGMRFDNCFCTNSICTPSRATILSGTYNHVNGVTVFATLFDGRQPTFPQLLQKAGYQTAVFGKWHLGRGGVHDPTGFDAWRVLPGQGLYHDPLMYDRDGERTYPGYATDLITDMSLDWLRQRDKSRPFCLLCHHKAPHRPWEPDAKHARMYDGVDIPAPATFDDDYATRTEAAHAATMRIERDFNYNDLKLIPPSPERARESLAPPERIEGYTLQTQEGETVSFKSHAELKHWKYQRYIKDYLRCVASVDDNIGRMLYYLDAEGLAENTIVVYTSDQGFYLGEHGWYDKRFMYEESLRMPFVVRYPNGVKPETASDKMVLNVDFAQTFLDYAGVEAPERMQGASIRPLLEEREPEGWRTCMYYRYWMHKDVPHNVYAHYGLRTERHKLIYYYGDGCGQPGASDERTQPEWELFDLQEDPYETNNLYGDPAYADLARRLKDELHAEQARVGDEPMPNEAP